MEADDDEVEIENEQQPTVAPALVQSPASNDIQEIPAQKSRLSWDQNTSMLYGVIAVRAAEEPVSRATLVDIMEGFGYAEGSVSAALWALAHEDFLVALGGGFYQLNKAKQGEVHQHAERRRSAMRQQRQR